DHQLPPAMPPDAGVARWYYAYDAKRRHDEILDQLWPVVRRFEHDFGVRFDGLSFKTEVALTRAEIDELAILDALCAVTTDAEQARYALALVQEHWRVKMRDDVLRKRFARVKQAAAKMGQHRKRIPIEGREYLRGARDKRPILLPPRLRLRFFWALVQ